MESVFVGIDVAFAKNKPLPLAMAVRNDDRLLPLHLAEHPSLRPPRGEGNRAILNAKRVRLFAADAVAYVERVAKEFHFEIAGIAIDAPSNYCSERLPRRAAEIAMDRAGVSCFATPTASQFEGIVRKAAKHIADGQPDNRIPHSNQLWMLVGFELFRAFRQLGECRETFPQAIIRSLGAADIYKSSREGLAHQFEAVTAAAGWTGSLQDLNRVGFGRPHDRLDAVMCAWVASRNKDELIAHGLPPDDVIWVPKVERAILSSTGSVASEKQHHRRDSPNRSIAHLVLKKREGVIDEPMGLPASELSNKSVRCPACHKKVFSRWPLGWDSHAAHKCDGLTEVEPEARKLEFKTRYREMFI